MPTVVHAHQHDTVDAICYRALGTTAGVTEQTLALNPGLADHGPLLAQGTPVTLPDQPDQPASTPQVNLWD